jgi:glycosyltransferase involved in cell wall biosynthesis
MDRKKIVIVTQYFPPEIGGGANRSAGFAEELAALGNDVTVVTPFPGYLLHGERARMRFRPFQMQHESGFVVYRTFVVATNRRSLFKRMAYYLSFTLSALLVLLLKIKKIDYVLVISPPIFTGIVGVAAKMIRSCTFILDIGDIWTNAAIQLHLLKSPKAIQRAQRLEQWIYRNADTVNLVTPNTFERFARTHQLSARVLLVPNFVDTTYIRRLEKPMHLAHRLQLTGKMVFGYAGNIGRAQGIQTIVQAAELTRQVKEIVYLIIGEGVERPQVAQLIKDHDLHNVVLLPPVSREEILAYISLIDVMIIPLVKAELFRETIPSKLYECMASEIPVILCVDGEARRLVESSGCGVFSEPEDPIELASTILNYYHHPEFISEFGSNGRTVAEQRFDIEKVIERFWHELTSPGTDTQRLPQAFPPQGGRLSAAEYKTTDGARLRRRRR